MHSAPVLVLAWRRPDFTAALLERLGAHRPRRLFLACDGWDADAPEELVAAVRATREVLDRDPGWPCTVERRYADRNLGLRAGVSSAIDWFLEEVEEGIILEDDCLPHAEFLPYCEELLARYRDDDRVMCISGDNSSGTVLAGSDSYGFIRWPLIWGWATWRRAWRRYDHDLERVAALDRAAWERLLPDPVERRVWLERLMMMRSQEPCDTWDFVWALSVLADGGLCALPRVNLVTNVGFGPGATHTLGAPAPSAAPTGSILPLRHPDDAALDAAADRMVFDRALGGEAERRRFAWERTLRGRSRLALHRAVAARIPAGLRARLPHRAAPPWRRG